MEPTVLMVCPHCGADFAMPARVDPLRRCVEFSCLDCGRLHSRFVDTDVWCDFFPADLEKKP